MKYPTESPALMKYGSLIRDLAARGHNWRFYNENFRFIRQSHVSSLPWGTIHSELWLCSHSGTLTSKSLGSGVSPGPRTKADCPIPFIRFIGVWFALAVIFNILGLSAMVTT